MCFPNQEQAFSPGTNGLATNTAEQNPHAAKHWDLVWELTCYSQTCYCWITANGCCLNDYLNCGQNVVLLSVDFVDVETPTLFRRTPGVSTGNMTL